MNVVDQWYVQSRELVHLFNGFNPVIDLARADQDYRTKIGETLKLLIAGGHNIYASYAPADTRTTSIQISTTTSDLQTIHDIYFSPIPLA